MTMQEHVDQNVRLTLGDLMLQIIMLKSRIAELEQQQQDPPKMPLVNGKDTELFPEGN